MQTSLYCSNSFKELQFLSEASLFYYFLYCRARVIIFNSSRPVTLSHKHPLCFASVKVHMTRKISHSKNTFI